MKKILSVLLTAVLLISSVPQTVTAAELSPIGKGEQTDEAPQVFAGDGESDISDEGLEPETELAAGGFTMASDELTTYNGGGSGDVTRLEWLKALITTFDMTVEADNYPDNYFTDIDSSSTDYRDVMVATEFGLVDVEAGNPLCPDDPATREFAAHTLNLCLGYQPEADVTYSFSEKDTVTYPDDIQIAIDKGWFLCSGSDFLPDQSITTAEKDGMIAAAEAVIDASKPDATHVNSYNVLPGVKVIPEETDVVLTDDDELTFYDYSGNIAVNDVFVVISNGLPIARRALQVTVNGNETVVKVESVDANEAFSDIDVEGELDVDLTQVQALNSSVSLSYIVGGTPDQQYEDGTVYYSVYDIPNKEEVTAVVATKELSESELSETEGYSEISHYNAGASGEFSVKKDGLKISCKISDFKPTLKVDLSRQIARVVLSGKVTFTVGTDSDGVEIPYLEEAFVKVPLGVAGYIEPSAVGKLKGEVSLSYKCKVDVGAEYINGQKRLIFGFKKEAFTLEAKAEITLGLKLEAGLDFVAAKADIYFEGGAKGTAKIQKHLDGLSPEYCAHLTAYLYAEAGVEFEFDILVTKKKFKLKYDIFDDKNSPVKIAIHFDDWQKVSVCARDSSLGSGAIGGGMSNGSPWGFNYYTPFGSQYAYNGQNTGTGANGQTYAIFEYTLDADDNATITKYNGNVSALNIPKKIDGHTVVGIGKDVFKNNTRIQMVTMPDTVTKIGSNAFAGCSNLVSVDLSKKLAVIGYAAFAYCNALTEIEIPKSVDYVPENYLTENMTAYPNGAFYRCDNLKKVTFEEGTTEIAQLLFAYCLGLEEIIIPNTVTSIEYGAFYNCKYIKKVTFSEALTSVESLSFYNCQSLEKVLLPDGVTYIGSEAFCYCYDLAEAPLPKKLETIGYKAFAYCDKIKDIYIPKSLKKVTSAFNRYVLDGVYCYCDGIESVEFEDGIEAIPMFLFNNCGGIKKLKLRT